MPVLEGEGRVIGVLSEADLLPKEEFRDGDPNIVSAQPPEDAVRYRPRCGAGAGLRRAAAGWPWRPPSPPVPGP